MADRITLIAGPAGGGKSTFAAELAAKEGATVVSTDDFKGLPWDEVPSAVRAELDKHDGAVILEGVRALSVVHHEGLSSRVDRAYWADRGPGRDGCEGLERRQRDILREIGDSLPPRARIPARNSVDLDE